MEAILEKISSYNIFNYLVPGVLFAVVADAMTSYRFLQDNVIVGLFIYYFIGLVISRIGSLLVEPILKKIGFISFVEYSKFIAASKPDPKINLLSETNNMYRTLCSTVLLLLAVVLFDKYAPSLPWLDAASLYIVGVALLALFLFAYRKQTKYIVKRVNNAVKKE